MRAGFGAAEATKSASAMMAGRNKVDIDCSMGPGTLEYF
jgi:hypothetical protein